MRGLGPGPGMSSYAPVAKSLGGALDFLAGSYVVNGASYGSLASIPGWAYSRSGSLQVFDSDGGVDTFAADTPPINGFGLHSYAAVTAFAAKSQTFDTWSMAGLTMAANTTVAPDGTTTADTATISASNETLRTGPLAGTIVSGQPYTFSFAALRGTATNMNSSVFDVTANNRIVGPTSYFPKTDPSKWARIIMPFVPTNTTIQMRPLDSSGVTSGTVILWGAMLLVGTFADGGPYVNTTTSVVTTSAADASFTYPNGTYSVTYTFEDGSTQVVAKTVSDGKFHIDTCDGATGLTRGRIARVDWTA